MKPPPNHGMIPPPPTPIQTAMEKPDQLDSGNIEDNSQVSIEVATTPTSSIQSQSLVLSPITLNTTTNNNRTDSATTGFSEKLTSNDSESMKPTSPSCLRPYRKVDDVTTVKRQPKSGWL